MHSADGPFASDLSSAVTARPRISVAQASLMFVQRSSLFRVAHGTKPSTNILSSRGERVKEIIDPQESNSMALTIAGDIGRLIQTFKGTKTRPTRMADDKAPTRSIQNGHFPP